MVEVNKRSTSPFWRSRRSKEVDLGGAEVDLGGAEVEPRRFWRSKRSTSEVMEVNLGGAEVNLGGPEVKPRQTSEVRA